MRDKLRAEQVAHELRTCRKCAKGQAIRRQKLFNVPMAAP